jgi:transcriptional regulator with XRE-family HTH domain
MFDILNEAFYMVHHEESVQARLATNLRRLRIARHLSLSELARATGISKATLSGIENGRANPTVETLAGLAAALRVSLVDLLEELPLPDVRVVRASAATAEPRAGMPRRVVDAIAGGGPVEVSELRLAPAQSREGPLGAKGSRVHVYVLEGKLIAGPVEQSTELGAGDYAAFPGDVPHAYETLRRPARVLLLSQAAAA